jgi:hypothetical protein
VGGGWKPELRSLESARYSVGAQTAKEVRIESGVKDRMSSRRDRVCADNLRFGEMCLKSGGSSLKACPRSGVPVEIG